MSELVEAKARNNIKQIEQKLILLHENDNVLICISPLKAGETITIGGDKSVMQTAIAVGHKVAHHALAVGDKVIKYGAAIGSVTCAIDEGEHVHLHNMRSDYIASHSRSSYAETE